ncbi:MAG: hypothetical protein AAFP89_23570 [Bacteroidota bacterium]
MKRFVYILPILFLAACEGFFGTKTDIEFLDIPVFDDREIAYVPIQPVWDDFEYPVDIIAGWDELIYIADGATEEIVSYDQAGNELGRFAIPGLTAIAQDRRLELLAAGTFDTTINNIDYTLATIYRLSLENGTDYGLKFAQIKSKIIHPYYFKQGIPTVSDTIVRFKGIGIRANNRYYVSRNGVNNNPLKFGGPDDAVLQFDTDDTWLSIVPVNVTGFGQFRDYFKKPQGLATRIQPPQTDEINLNTPDEFVYGSVDPEAVFRVQVIRFVAGSRGASFNQIGFPALDTSITDRIVYEPFRFTEPVDVTFGPLPSSFFFVVDAARDSVYQFTNNGYEGVAPPNDATGRLVNVSFGGTGAGLTQFNEPRGVAYLRDILFVADAGNGRILRFKLTTDIE